MDIKEKLNKLYTKCDLLDNYNINSNELRSEIISIDTLCDNLSDDSNLSNSNVKVKGDYKSLYLRYSILNDKINNYLKSLHIFNIIQKVNKDIKKEDLNKLLEEILNDLMNYNNSKLELEEFNSLYPSLYQLIKLEFKYTGKSMVLNYIRNSSLDQYKIDELFYDELSERFYSPLINKITLQTATKNYIEYDKYLLYLSVIEDGYLDEIFEELEKYNVENSNLYFILNEIKEKTKNQKEINDTNKRMKYKQYTRLFPALLSLIILISANTAAKDKIDEKTSSYKTTTEVYDTIDGYSTNISYDTLEVGDIKITVYNNGIVKYSNVTAMDLIFAYCISLTSLPDISKWNTSNAKIINSFFYNCTSLVSLPDISKWNTGSIRQYECLYCNNTNLLLGHHRDFSKSLMENSEKNIEFDKKNHKTRNTIQNIA